MEWIEVPSEGLTLRDIRKITKRDQSESAAIRESVEAILQAEIGQVFKTVLTHAGVYKRDAEGMAAFDRFMDEIIK